MRKVFIYAILLSSLAFYSCKEDSYDRVFKQYLYSRAAEAQEMHDAAVEGVAEGEFKSGAKTALQSAIDEGMALYRNENATQTQVDEVYNKFTEVIATFEDRMNPFFSEMDFLIQQCNGLIDRIEVGDGEGKIPLQADKDELTAAVTQARQYISSTPNITQRMLTDEQNRLQVAMYLFEGKIPGKTDIYVENPSFEQGASGNKVYDFDNISAWNWGNPRYLSNITNPDQDGQGCYLLNKDQGGWSHFTWDGQNSVDGSFVMLTNPCARQVWQRLQEGVHANARYTVSVKAGMNQWTGDIAEHRIRIQLAIFNGNVGDLDNITVLKEQSFPLAEDSKGVLIEKTMICEIPVLSEHLGKRMIVTLSGYKGRDPFPGNVSLDYSAGQIFFDMVEITREKIAE